MSVKIIAIILSSLILIFVIELIRRERLNFKYGFSWMFVSCLGIFFAVFDKFLFKISSFLGFELPSNFVFFVLLSIFVLISLLMTIFLCRQNNRNDIMAQKIALLEQELNELKKS